MKGVQWDYMPNAGGEMGKVLTHPLSTAVLFVFHPLDPPNVVKRSGDGGKTCTTILGIPILTPVDEEPPDLYPMAAVTQKSFVMDPSQPMRLLLGSPWGAIGKILETKNSLANPPNWTSISGVLSPSSKASDQFITALAIAPSDGNTVYAATGDRRRGRLRTVEPSGSWRISIPCQADGRVNRLRRGANRISGIPTVKKSRTRALRVFSSRREQTRRIGLH